MATHCDYIDPETGVKCDWKGTKAGKAIHQAKAHGIHRGYGEGVGEASCRIETLDDSWTVESTIDLESGKVTIREVPNKGLLEPIVDRVGNLD